LRNSITVLLAVAVAACGGSPGQPSPDRAGLAYTVPDPNPLRYTVADTGALGMNMNGMQIDIAMRSAASVEAAFTETANGLSATLRYVNVEGSFLNSMAPSINVGAADLPGPANISLDPKGGITMDVLPQTSEAFRQVLGAEGAFRKIFVRLPGRVVDPGATWTDTVTVSENIGEVNRTGTEIITSVLGNDTTVDGHTYRVIRAESQGETRIAGQTQGMDITQTIRIRSTAVILWDAERRAVFRRTSTGSGTGTMEMPAMGVSGVPITMTSKSILSLQSM